MGQLTNLYVSQSYQGLLKLENSTTGLTTNLQTVQDGLGGNSPLQISQTEVNISGSFSINNIPFSVVDTGSFVTTSSFNSFTSSVDLHLAGLDIETGSLQSQIDTKLNTSSFNSYTSSNDSRVNSLISQTGSYVTETESGSFMITGSVAGDTLTFTKGNGSQFSLQVNTGSLPSGVVSGSAQIVDLGFATTSSLDTLSGSIATTDLGQNNRLTSIENKTGSFATTGSNIFIGNQTITGSVNQTGSMSIRGTDGTTPVILTVGHPNMGPLTIKNNGEINTFQSIKGFGMENINASPSNYAITNAVGDISIYGKFQTGSVVLGLNQSSKTIVTGSLSVSNGITGSLEGTASYATQALSASYAPDISNRNGLITTGSIGGTQSITGSLNVEGTITATSASFTYVNTVYETASVIYSSGSNQLGDASDDTQTLWGTVNLPSGPLVITGSLNASGSQHTIVGNTLITGALKISSSATYDIEVTGSVVITRPVGSNSANNLFVTNSNGAATIGATTILSRLGNTTTGTVGTLSGYYNSNRSYATNDELGFTISPILSSLSGGTGNVIFTNDPTDSFPAMINFQNKATWTDGRISLLRSTDITGSLIVTNGITGSLEGTSSYAVNALSASYAPDTTNTGSLVTSVVGGPITFEDQITVTKGDGSSSIITINNVTNADSSSYSNYAVSSSQAQNSNLLNGTGSGIFATTGSNTFTGRQTILNDLEINSPNPIGTFVSIISTGTTSFLLDSPLTQFQSNGEMLFQNTISSTGSADINFRTENGGDIIFNTSNSGSVAVTGSVNISGSQHRIIGNTNITGSLILSGSVGPELDVKGDVIITGSVIMSGSAGIELDVKGDQTNTGSVNISGSLNVVGPVGLNLLQPNPFKQNLTMLGGVNQFSSSTVLNNYLNAITTSLDNDDNNFALIPGGAISSPAGIAALTGSVFISGSNNLILNLGSQLPASQGRRNLMGSANIVITTPSINTSSLTIPTINNNYSAGGLTLTLTTGSSAGNGAHNFNGNVNLGSVTWNHPSASIGAGQSSNVANNINVGTITSTTTGPTLLTAVSSLSSNIVSNANLALNNISSSIQSNNNIIAGNTFTVNNRYFQTGSNNFLANSSNIFGGQVITVNAAGAPSTNVSRTLVGNLIGGQTVNISLEQNNTDLGGLRSSIVYGVGLNVTGSHSAANTTQQAATFIGRWNGEDNGLADSARTIFAVGTGTATGTRRTGLYVTSGSLVGVSGSFSVIGNSTLTGNNTFNGDTIMSSSSTFPLFVSGTLRTQRLHFDGNVFNNNPSSNLGAIRMSGDNQTLQYTNYDLAQITTQSFIDQYVNTGSLTTQTKLGARYAGTEVKLELVNNNGVRNVDIKSDSITVTGSLNLNTLASATGSYVITTDDTGLINKTPYSAVTQNVLNIGSFYSTQSQSGSAGVSQSINYNTTDISQGVNLVSGSQLTITKQGTYNIQFSAQVLSTTGADDVWFWLKKNGTNVPDSAGRVTLANNEEIMAAWNYLVTANVGDYFELAWQNLSSNGLLLYNAPTGNIPAVTSIITTVTQVR